MGDIINESRINEILNNFGSHNPIVVVGDLAIDKYTHGSVDRISPEAPVPVLRVDKEWMKLGMAANISDNLKALEVESTLCGIVGEDKNASLMESLLEERQLKIWGLLRDSNRPTILKERVTTDVQQICRVDYESTEEITEEIEGKFLSRLKDFKDDHSALIIEDYAKGTLTESFLNQVISLYKENNKLVCVDPGNGVDPLFYKGAHLLKPNLKEAHAMAAHLGYQEKSLENIAALLVDKLELEKLVITLGAQGMALVDKKENQSFKIIPTVANEVFDVSGAGDTVISVLTLSLLSGATLEEAAWLSNCAAGVVVAKKGTATVSKEELLSFYRKFAKKL